MSFFLTLLLACALLCFKASAQSKEIFQRSLKFQCNPGYWNDNGNCKPCQTPNCQVCQPPNGASCTQCIQSYSLKNGNCVQLGNPPNPPAPAGQCDFNCQVCNQPPFCQNCKIGFFNDNGTCKKCETPNCQVCQPPAGEQCTQCISPYVLNYATNNCEMPSGRKLSSIDDQECDTDMACEFSGRQLKVATGCNANVAFCLKCAQPNICQNCQVGFFNNNGKCIKCKTQNCQVCQPPDGTQCTQCLRPFTINHQTGQCDQNGNVYPNPTNAPCGPSCKVCPGNGPFCQNCEDGYWNDNGFCKMCQSTKCKVCQPNNGATCTQCLDGFTLSNNTCT